MDYISQFANQDATQEQIENNPKLKSRIDGSRRNESLISMLKEGDSLNE
jgi:hypothetical protein